MDDQHRKISGYRDLTQEEIDLINEVKTQAEMVRHLVDKLEARARTQGAIDGRAIAIARADLQTGFMWLSRSIARPIGF